MLPEDPIEHAVTIRSVRRLNSLTAVLVLDAPLIAAAATPGQFVNVTCDQFLRRPIGIMAVQRREGLIELGIRAVGAGTRNLLQKKPGDPLSVLGPLGHGFQLDGLRRVITVGGGSGVFPLFFVQQVCRERGIDALAVCGYRSKNESILRDEYAGLGCQTLFAADAGDLDVAGQAADALAQLLRQLPPVPGTAILTCGPRPMMQAVAELARRNQLPCQVSLEERMACGIGVCLVCACQVKADGKTGYQRCCVDGPVFDAEVVAW
ncbi:MAG: dihydroorotate dehydrogenase electron transfer subunit [Clostridiaceae bacterium]|jgi:dihydroorotate dehydrogenase electron transfer subunit|nr:dihydroorotate dehydrogenase electron transfer subunit [Clostridiaceae bacterium]